MIAWLRRRILAGFFAIVPLVISVAVVIWIFGIIDALTAPLATRVLGRGVEDIGRPIMLALGILVTLGVVLVVGTVVTNVIGRRFVARAEGWLMLIPVFRTIYAPVKQLLNAFSPDNEYGFKRVVMVENAGGGWAMGFLTKEFTVTRDADSETMMAVYIPTNHLYLGDVVIYPRSRGFFPDLSVEEGVRIFLTGGMSLPGRIAGSHKQELTQ